MSAQTSRQRVLAALNHRQPDRTPIFEYVLLSPVASQILGRNFTDYGGDQNGWMRLAAEHGFDATLRQYAIDRVELAQMLGHDMIYCVPNPTEKMVRAYAQVRLGQRPIHPSAEARQRCRSYRSCRKIRSNA